IEYNEAFYTFYRSAPETRYYAYLDYYLPDGRLASYDELPISRALRGEKVTEIEYTTMNIDNGETWVGSFSFSPMRDKEGIISGSVVVARDVTKTKQVEAERERLIKQLAKEKEALAESEEKYRIMGEAVDYGVWAADADGKVTYL